MELIMPTDIALVADKERLHQLLVILLDNAIKYTASGKVTISGLQQSSQMLMKIRDSGCGILAMTCPMCLIAFFGVIKPVVVTLAARVWGCQSRNGSWRRTAARSK